MKSNAVLFEYEGKLWARSQDGADIRWRMVAEFYEWPQSVDKSKLEEAFQKYQNESS